MNLVLDFGNTRIKAALFKGEDLLEVKMFQSADELLSDHIFLKNFSRTIICSVTSEHESFLSRFSFNEPLLFAHDTPVPLKNRYQSAATLGSDRLAAAVGGFSLYPKQNVLSVDAGTCIKYNFVNASGEYLGGAISPGIPMRLKALHQYTNRLPLITADFNYEKLTGQNTTESILSGCLLAATAEVDAMIDRYRIDYPDIKVIVTGGDGPYLCKQLKNRIFAHPDLVLKGLNTILNFNIEK